ncbi:synaptic vesicle 2-related protein isoform X2 [Bombyx mori]
MVLQSAYDNEGFHNNEPCGYDNEAAKTHTFDEAIELAGNGRYNIILLATMSTAIIAMGLDMFGFSVIVTGASCDFQLDHAQKSILLSMPFGGSIIMAYPWGYISDTQGRRKSLLIALSISYVVSTLSAFSPHWIVLAVLRFISTSFCSCAQSATYTLLGESCSVRVKGAFLLIMTSVLNFGFATYMLIAYGILNQKFSYDLGLLTFIPWRLLTIVLALPLGISAISLFFLCESPKFLLNSNKEGQALEVIKRIWEINRQDGLFPVKKLVLNEEGNVSSKDVPFLRSLWQQTVPLFKPPLLFGTIKLFYLTSIIYSVSNAFYVWYPFLVDSIIGNLASPNITGPAGLCEMISFISSSSAAGSETSQIACVTGVDSTTVLGALVSGVFTVAVNLAISKLSSRKKTLSISIFLISGLVGAATTTVTNNIVAFILFFGLAFVGLGIGVVFSYYVDLYPTSYRGMAACLGVMVARLSGLGGINLIGAYITTNCETTFYVCSAYMLSGALVSMSLPADRIKK